MIADILTRARTFMQTTHLLTPEETEETLAVASDVLHKGLARLDAALRAGDAHQCLESSHSLRGNLLNLGLRELATTAARAMEQAQAGDLAPIREAHTTLTRALEPLLTLPVD